MTIEIRELVIQARVLSEDKQPLLSGLARMPPEEEWVEAVSRRVLENLRERGWRGYE